MAGIIATAMDAVILLSLGARHSENVNLFGDG
jgi:hypothetical protein